MTSTEVALRTSPGTIAVPEEFSERFPAVAPDAELAELLGDVLGEVELSPKRLPRLKVPSGGGPLWQIIEDGKPAATAELKGALAYFRKQRAFWVDPDPKGNAPDCASLDGKTPVEGGMYAPGGEMAAQNPTHTCKACPMAQAGSDIKGGRGAACKDQRILFLVEEGKLLPTVVTVPPSSVKSFEDFIISLVNAKPMIPWWGVGVNLTLEKATNAAGNEFSRIVFSGNGRFGPEETELMKDFRAYIKALVEESDPAEFIDGGNGEPADIESQGVSMGAGGAEE